ncbi:MAG: FAD:protein FMN transferase [Roseivivax sp.]|nr:FAD:protein FMN transferase [Roseivivax sp.]
MNRRRFLALSAAFACAPRLALAHTWQGRALGAEVSVTLTGPRAMAESALAAIPPLLEAIEAQFSLYREGSALNELNAAGRLVRPGAMMRALLAEAGRAHALTGGLFDPTVQPLWQALAMGADPAPARAAIGWHRVTATAEAVTLAPGQALTLNGIAQGYATDLVRDLLAAHGATRALVDIGEFAALGGPFSLGVEDPAQGLVATRRLSDGAIATSSPGALSLGASGHILAPDGRAPLWSTVSVEARSATLADALSTAAVFLDRGRLETLKDSANVARITAVAPDGRLITV